MIKEKGNFTTGEIALTQRVTEARVRELWYEYRRAGVQPVMGNPGRPRRRATAEELEAIMKGYARSKCEAVLLERILGEGV